MCVCVCVCVVVVVVVVVVVERYWKFLVFSCVGHFVALVAVCVLFKLLAVRKHVPVSLIKTNNLQDAFAPCVSHNPDTVQWA